MQTCFLLLIGLQAGGASKEKEPPPPKEVVFKEIELTMAPEIGSLKYRSKEAYKDKLAGYSVTYGNRRSCITVSIYDMSFKELPFGKSSEFIKEQLKIALGDMLFYAGEDGTYKNVKPMKEPPPLAKPILEVFDHVGFTCEIPEEPTQLGAVCRSYVLLTSQNNLFVKIRVTQFLELKKFWNDDEVSLFVLPIAAKMVDFEMKAVEKVEKKRADEEKKKKADDEKKKKK